MRGVADNKRFLHVVSKTTRGQKRAFFDPIADYHDFCLTKEVEAGEEALFWNSLVAVAA